MRCIYSQSYILILPKLFYLQTSVQSQRSYIGRQASCVIRSYISFFKWKQLDVNVPGHLVFLEVDLETFILVLVQFTFARTTLVLKNTDGLTTPDLSVSHGEAGRGLCLMVKWVRS